MVSFTLRLLHRRKEFQCPLGGPHKRFGGFGEQQGILPLLEIKAQIGQPYTDLAIATPVFGRSLIQPSDRTQAILTFLVLLVSLYIQVPG